MIKKTLLAFTLLGILIAAASCNTMRGLGRDVSIAGDAITEAAGGAP
jgi:predicted small secreted protein